MFITFRSVCLAVLLAGFTPVLAAASQPVNGLGMTLPAAWLNDDAPPGRLPPLPAAGDDGGVQAAAYVRVLVDAGALQMPARTAGRLQMLAARNMLPVLILEPPVARERTGFTLGFDLNRWLHQVDALLQALEGAPVVAQVMEQPLRHLPVELYAFVLKRTAVAVRAAAPGSLICSGEMKDAAMIQRLAEAGVAPYIDAILVHVDAGHADGLDTVRLALPATAVWLAADTETSPHEFIRQAGLAFSRGVPLVFAGRNAWPEPEVMAVWQRLLQADTVLVPPEFRRVTVSSQGEAVPAEQVLELAQADGRRHIVVFGGDSSIPLEMLVTGPRVSVAWLLNMQDGTESMGAAAEWLVAGGAPGSAAVSKVTLAPAPRPLVIRLGRVGAGAPQAQREEVQGRRGLTVEEIVARHQEVQAAQERRLRTVEADVRIDFHFSVANLNQTFDVRTLNRLFHEGGRTVYEERQLYLNGALWTGERTPDLPFVLPERVTEVPLDLRLDRSYLYELKGMEDLQGVQSYIVSFAPGPDAAGAYRGKVWIDADTFVKRRMEVVELTSELPVVSNTIRQEFAPVEAAGRTWWLLARMSGEMIFTALGRNVVLERDLSYSNYLINEPAFERRLEDLYAADSPILEETADGYRRLERVGAGKGGRRDRETLEQGGVSRLLVGVWSIGDDFDVGIPFAGVNYFNFDWRGTGNQLDVAWAGPFLNVLWSDPSFGGGKAILALEARLNPLRSTDRHVVEPLGEIKEEQLQVSQQKLRAILGRPLGAHHKLEWQIDVDYFDYRRDEDTAADFVLPDDTWQGASAVRWTYTRSGWRVDTAWQIGRRERWSPWGVPDGSDYSEDHRLFTRSILTLNKSFYSSRRSKAGFRLSLYNGHHLDRFSSFEVGGWDVARVPGYNGDGVGFNTGGILDLNTGVALGSRVRLDFNLSHARVLNEEDLGPDTQHLTGASVAVNFAGPFSSLMRVRVGAGLGSSITGVDGGGALRVTYFRTFRRWFWQKRGHADETVEKKAPAP